MKAIIFIAALFLNFTILAQNANSSQGSDNVKSEKESIKQVLIAETEAYYNRNYNALADTWIQNENSVVAWNGKDGGYTHMRGWDAIGDYYRNEIDKNKNVKYPDFKVSDLAIEISGNLAYVVYNEYVANKSMLYSKVPGIKTLKKDGGQWRLHSIISFWDRNYQYSKEDVTMMMKASKYDTYSAN